MPDSALWERMNDLVSLGVSDSDVITRHLHSMTVNEIYHGEFTCTLFNRVQTHSVIVCGLAS